MSIEDEHLANKVVLEVGSGRGDTTRKLVDLIAGQHGSQLIATDISDRFFQELQTEFEDRDIQIRFICTSAQELNGVPNNSVDYLVCNYTLCAVNAQDGLAMLALRRFWEVLKNGGRLFVEEEFPIDRQATPVQEIWAGKWRILKSAMILAGKLPFNEVSPDILCGLCRLAGFEDVCWTAHTVTYTLPGALDFFHSRLDSLLKHLPNESLQTGFADMAKALRTQAIEVGGMEVPYYRLNARK